MKGLRDEAFMRRKAEAEAALREQVAADPEMAAAYADAWDKIAASRRVAAENLAAYNLLERGLAFESRLFQIARTIVRLAEEKAKPNEDRLREYRESDLASLELDLYSEAPIYPEFEAAKLANALDYWRQTVGADDPVVRRVLRGRDPEQVARELVEGSKLADVADRKQLAEGDAEAIAASDDPMIKLALAVDPEARAVRKIWEDQVEGVEIGPVRPDRQGPVRPAGRRRLSRRHLHAPPGLRHRQGLRAGRRDDPALHPMVEGLFEQGRVEGERRALPRPRVAGSRRRKPAGSTSTRR